MSLKYFWAEADPGSIAAPLTPNADSTTHQITYSAYVPNSAHVVKVVSHFGINVVGHSIADLSRLGHGLAWGYNIQLIEGSSDVHPSGYIHTVEKQAGAFQTTGVMQPHLAPHVGDNATVRDAVLLSHYAAINPVNQKRSDGSVNQSIGIREYAARFYVYGVPNYGEYGRPLPYLAEGVMTYACQGSMRVLYQLEVPGGGGEG